MEEWDLDVGLSLGWKSGTWDGGLGRGCKFVSCKERWGMALGRGLDIWSPGGDLGCGLDLWVREWRSGLWMEVWVLN